MVQEVEDIALVSTGEQIDGVTDISGRNGDGVDAEPRGRLCKGPFIERFERADSVLIAPVQISLVINSRSM